MVCISVPLGERCTGRNAAPHFPWKRSRRALEVRSSFYSFFFSTRRTAQVPIEIAQLRSWAFDVPKDPTTEGPTKRQERRNVFGPEIAA